ncbi:MAG: hypothetical protein QNJ41_16660 [Xenococcaceae cyanobacterium MO_188.B32]|nr:hypothetical protein [Xenococcaceae cyanobacterium MO_188.B32]
MSIAEESVTELRLASEQDNQSSQSQSPELCPIKTEPKQNATTSEYIVPMAIAVRNRPGSIEVKGGNRQLLSAFGGVCSIWRHTWLP